MRYWNKMFMLSIPNAIKYKCVSGIGTRFPCYPFVMTYIITCISGTGTRYPCYPFVVQ